MKARQSVLLRNLYVDGDNPRHDPIDFEPEIIEHLLAKEQVVEIAKHIASTGLSPLDGIGAVAHQSQKGRYVVIEGNRRVCALLLLADPERAPREAIKRVFRELRAKARFKPDKVEIVVFDDRVEARPFLELKHGYGPEGAGVRKWSVRGKHRFDEQAGGGAANPNALAIRVINYGVARRLIAEGDAARLKPTTLTRYLNNPSVRKALGVARASTGGMEFSAPTAEVDSALAQFLDDATAGKVSSRSDKGERDDYARSLASSGVAVKTKAPATVVDLQTVVPRTAASPKARDAKDPRRRAKIVPPTFSYPIADNIHRRIFRELKKVDAEEFPFSGAYLLRAMLELCSRAYAKKHRLGTGKVHAVLLRAIQHMEASGVNPKELQELKKAASRSDWPYSPMSLGNAIHGGAVPTRAELNAHWDSMEAGIKHLLDGAN